MPETETLPTTERLLDLVDAMAGQPILMLVDLVADRFISGSPKRISREAPVLILSYESETFSPGGGANAVANVAALGGVPLPLGIVGRDANGEQLVSKLQSADVTTDGIGETSRKSVEPPTPSLIVERSRGTRSRAEIWDCR